MQEKTDDRNFVEELRLKTEESDLDQQLKPRFGGYTKQSVLDYLNNLRKNQQMTADTFKLNLQTLYNEKEALSKNYEALQQKFERVASENQELKSKHGELEAQFIQQQAEMTDIKARFEPLDEENRRLSGKLDLLEKEDAATKEMLTAQTGEVRRLEEQISDMTQELETKQDEIQYFKAIEADGEKAALGAKVNALTEQLAAETEILAKLNSQMAFKEQAIRVLQESGEAQKQKILELTKTLESGLLQNEKLLLAQDTLTRQMQEEYEKNLAMIKARSELVIERLVVQRKLDEANSRIAMLELENKKSGGPKDMKSSLEAGMSS